MSDRVTREQFLAAGLGGAVALSSGTGVALAAKRKHHKKKHKHKHVPQRPLDQIEHVVILMQENRSFDTYFGTLAGVRGFSDTDVARQANGHTVFYQPYGAVAGGELAPWHLDTHASNPCSVLLDNSWGPMHDANNGGRNDGWANADGPFTMAYSTRSDVPWHMALADEFLVCDRYHCSVLGPTNPNRYYMWTGMIDPTATGGGPAIDNSGTRYTWTTYPERLEAAGVSWRVYHEEDDFDDNILKFFAQYQDAQPGTPLHDRAMVNLPATQFADDVANDALPQVSWIVAPTADSEHPGYSQGRGGQYCDTMLRALFAHPEVYAKTAFILTYDETGGYFDHVVPTLPPPGTAAEFVGGVPIGLGFRVPTVIVSPWTRGRLVCSQVFDHTSLIQLLEQRFGVHEPNISDWRRRTCGDLVACFDFAHPDTSIPTLPATAAGAAEADRLCANAAPAVPPALNGAFPTQEPGSRTRRAA